MSQIKGNLDLHEITAYVAEQTQISQGDVKTVLKEFFHQVAVGVADFGYVELHGFGSFRLKNHPAESGKTPQGEPYSVGERVSVDFNAFSGFSGIVSEKTGKPCIS